MTLQTKFIVAIATAMVILLSFGVWFLDSSGRTDRIELLQREANIILGFAKSSRHYVNSDLCPAITRAADAFVLAGEASTFATQSIFKYFNRSYPGFTYRQPTSNPFNKVNFPTPFEEGLINTFLNNNKLTEASGFYNEADKKKYYYSQPLFAEKPCLRCHGDPETAPAALVAKYGTKNGFNWQDGEVVGATVVTIPADGIIKSMADGRLLTILMFAAIFLLVPVITLFLFQNIIGRRLQRSGQLMLEIAATPNTGKRFHVSGDDEVGQMESAFNQVVDKFQQTQTDLGNRLQQLVEEEDRFRSLAFSAIDGFISSDKTQKILTWNRGATEIFGYSEEEIIGSYIDRLIPKRYIDAHHKGFNRVATTNPKTMDRKPKEAMGIHKLGHEIPIEISLSSWSTRGKQNFFAIIRDTSERQRAKEKSQRELLSRIAFNSMLEIGMKKSTLDEKLEKILQVTLAVHWLSIQYKGCIFLLNEKTEMLEMVVQVGLHENIKKMCHILPIGKCLCGQAAASKEIVAAMNIDKRHEIAFEGMEPHGHYCVPIMHEERLLGVLNLYLDHGHGGSKDDERFLKSVAHNLAGVIDREYTARRVRQLSQATEQSPASVVITNPDGIIEYVNKRCCAVTGYSKDELVGKNPKLLKGGDLPDGVYKDLWNTIKSGREWRGELHNRKKNGELFWEDVAISPVRNRSGVVTHFLAVKEDVTQRKELEDALGQLLSTLDQRVAQRTEELNAKVDELERTRNELVESEKMASLGRLVAGFAHEINTPIGVAVAGSSQIEEAINSLNRLLEEDEVEEYKILHIMDIIKEASVLTLSNLRRAGTLIASFKRTSVDQSSEEVRLFNVLETTQDVVRSLRNQLKKTKIELHLECPNDLQIYGTPGILDQLLTNLIMNSIIHGFKDGSKAGEIRINIKKIAGRFDLEYADTGVGMDDVVRKKVFEPFYTTHRAHGGSGLGLYLCYNLVTSKLNGTISCESSKGEGVKFQISFPIGDKIL